jgi:hypothetical protein
MEDLDESKLHDFVGRVLGDIGGAASVPLVRIGHELGLYAATTTRCARTASWYTARLPRGASSLRINYP